MVRPNRNGASRRRFASLWLSCDRLFPRAVMGQPASLWSLTSSSSGGGGLAVRQCPSVVWFDLGGKEVACLTSGKIVGETSFVDSLPPVSYKPQKGLAVLTVAKDDLSERLEEEPGFEGRSYKVLAVYLSHHSRCVTAGVPQQQAPRLWRRGE